MNNKVGIWIDHRKAVIVSASADRVTTQTLESKVGPHSRYSGRACAETVQAKAEGWMDRERLYEQIARVRDGAADLLEELAGGATKASKEKPSTATARGGDRGRSGGVVDAPGKKHRKPMPSDPGANIVHSQVEKARMAKTMAKTSRRRGRG